MDSVALVNNKKNLDKSSEDLIEKIVLEQDSDKLKDLVGLFNTIQSKKNIVRVDTYSKLLDKISDQMVERFEKKPGEFSNKDLLDYLSAVRSAMDKSDIIPENINIPVIQNNTQVNLNIDSGLNKESRERVADAVSSILAKLKNNNSVIDITEEVEEIDEN
jgi:hypothetical protein